MHEGLIDLSELDDIYEKAVPEENAYETIPDGKYQASIDKVELKTTRLTNKPMLSMWLIIVAGPFRGKFLFKNNVMSSADNIKWLKQDLLTCGLKLQKLSDLQSRLEGLIGITLEVTKKTKGENENVYLNRIIELDYFKDDEVPF